MPRYGWARCGLAGRSDVPLCARFSTSALNAELIPAIQWHESQRPKKPGKSKARSIRPREKKNFKENGKCLKIKDQGADASQALTAPHFHHGVLKLKRKTQQTP